MKLGTLLCVVVLVVGVTATTASPVAGAAAQADMTAPALAKVEALVLQELATQGRVDFFVHMAEKADLSPAQGLATKAEKGKFVYEALRATADRTQEGLRRSLDAQGVSYEAFYIANKVLVYGGTQAMVAEVAERADVAQITANHQYQLEAPLPGGDAPDGLLSVEANVSFINADDVWGLGYSGQGMVIAGNDTGIDETHPAIARHYRGCLNPPACTSWDHNYNWWDATYTYPTDPYDGYGHGTHTTGTMVGYDGDANQIGVAPGATTVHCKNMTNGGAGSDSTFTTCFQWDLAPWNLSRQYPRPDLAPDAVNNSWGYSGGGFNQFRDEILALQAAGIAVEVSAGNEGPSCATLRSPGDYHEALTTGSVKHANPYPGTITGFSSRGPSDLDGNYFPDVMAPGESIRSSIPGGSYQMWSGTSMAGPHTTALVGLIWSACPTLQGQVELTFDLIRSTASPLAGQAGSNCGGDYVTGPNNDWGFGTIDALAAVQQALSSCGDAPPNVSTVDPEEGQYVNGTFDVQVAADDDAGITKVEAKIDDGEWSDVTGTFDGTYYHLPWNTTAYPEGSHMLQSRATDTANQSAVSPAVSAVVDNVADATMHVSNIAMSFVSLSRSSYRVTTNVTIASQTNAAVPQAAVSAQWTLPNGVKVNQQATTGTNGVATFTYTGSKGTYKVCVTNATKTGWTYNAGQNAETCDQVRIR